MSLRWSFLAWNLSSVIHISLRCSIMAEGDLLAPAAPNMNKKSRERIGASEKRNKRGKRKDKNREWNWGFIKEFMSLRWSFLAWNLASVIHIWLRCSIMAEGDLLAQAAPNMNKKSRERIGASEKRN